MVRCGCCGWVWLLWLGVVVEVVVVGCCVSAGPASAEPASARPASAGPVPAGRASALPRNPPPPNPTAATLSLKGRVDFTCLNCFSQTRFASAVEHELVDPHVECWTTLRWTPLRGTAQNSLFFPFPPQFRSFCVSLCVFSLNFGGV